MDLLIKRGLIPEKYGTNKQEKAKKDIDPKYNFLRQICSNPRNVEINDLVTDKGVLYPSTYTRLHWPWIKIQELLVCMMEKYGGTVMRSEY